MEKASTGVGTKLWQQLSSTFVPYSMGIDAAEVDDKAPNNAAWDYAANFSSFIVYLHTTKRGLSSHLHVGIQCDWLLQPRFQGLTRRMHEGTGMLSWPPRPLINAVSTADLYHSCRENWERLVLSALIRTKQKETHTSTVLSDAMGNWFRW